MQQTKTNKETKQKQKTSKTKHQNTFLKGCANIYAANTSSC